MAKDSNEVQKKEAGKVKIAAWSGEPSPPVEANTLTHREVQDNLGLPAGIPPWAIPGLGIDVPDGISELSPKVTPDQEKQLSVMQKVVAVARHVLGQLEDGITTTAQVARPGHVEPPSQALLERLTKP